MKVTQHAMSRMQQRGFQEGMMELLVLFGEPKSRPGGVVEYAMTNKATKRLIQFLDKVKAKAVVVNEETGDIVTAYNRIL